MSAYQHISLICITEILLLIYMCNSEIPMNCLPVATWCCWFIIESCSQCCAWSSVCSAVSDFL